MYPLETSCWGREGHYISARVAFAFLSDDAKTLLDELLPKKSLSIENAFYEASVWPDTVQGDPKYGWSTPMHFINTPYRTCDGFFINRDCHASGTGPCLVSAISNYTGRLLDISLPPVERQEALMFLTHFLADVNQPLHVGFALDKGGNKIVTKPPWDHIKDKTGKDIKSPRAKPLHVQWDSHLIQYTYLKAGQTWSQFADSLISDITRDRDAGSLLFTELPTNWTETASERAIKSSALSCTVAYKSRGAWISPSQHLPLDYYLVASGVVSDQLKQSGIDIAHTLNAIAYELNRFNDSDDDSTASGTSDYDLWENAFGSPDNEDELYILSP